MSIADLFIKAYFLSKKHVEGFTLIELLIVFSLVGILSAIALPALLSQSAKARQIEAKSYIGAINRAQQAYAIEHFQFADSIDRLNIAIPETTTNYSYSVNLAVTHVSAEARPLQITLKGYSGAINGIAGTIICQTKSIGSSELASPQWNAANSELVCPANMELMAQ